MKRSLGLVLLVGALLATFATLQSSKPGWWERLWYPLSYEQIVRGHARNYDLDPALLAAVIYQESKFKADARSKSGAIGLMQLLPDTAKGIALHTGGSRFRVEDLYDPEINVRYGAWYLRHLLDKYRDELYWALATLAEALIALDDRAGPEPDPGRAPAHQESGARAHRFDLDSHFARSRNDV